MNKLKLGGTARKNNFKALKKECEDLWSECIKAKAGYKSEYSGTPGRKIGGEAILNSHHIIGKPNLRLRFEIENGICLTSGEHKFIAHNPDRQETFRERVKHIKGENIYDRLNLLKNGCYKIDLKMMKLYFQDELDRYKNQ